jgi:hypothetical protein
MWSGPRNLSTAMMRSFGNRPDCTVVDEPLYAAYLAETGLDHPGRDDVIASQPTDWRDVCRELTEGPVATPLQYQKHMTHHLLPHIDRDWIAGLRNVLLIRDPREVVASYVKSRATVTADDIGLPQQVALYDQLCAAGAPPPIIDSGDFLRAPEAHLRALCDWLEIDFSDRMLHWPKGPRASDGVWAPHWYARVWESTGFEAPAARETALSGDAAEVAERCRPYYEWLHALRLAPSAQRI